MRTNIAAFLLASDNRKKIAEALFEYPKREWSCSRMEETASLSHTTVFRTLQSLHRFGLLKSTKINKKDIVYQLVEESPWVAEIKQLFTIKQRTERKIAASFAAAAKAQQKKAIQSIILYGSAAKGTSTIESDIDILVILPNRNKNKETMLYDIAAELSGRYNKTISLTIMDTKEAKREKKKQFLQSVIQSMEVVYGKGIP